jgi:serine protease Do
MSNHRGRAHRNAATSLALLIFFIFAAFSFQEESGASQGRQGKAESPDPIRKSIEDVIARVKPALVRIFVVNTKYQNGREIKYEAVGSGVMITREGHVITNHHVAGNARQIVCTLSDNEEIKAVLVSTDPLSDIAVIKLQSKDKRKFPYAEFGDSSLLKQGDPVLAMGSPFALSQSVTMGIVSNTKIVMPRFMWPFNQFTLDGEDVGSLVRWIGHDSPIYGGNSGGPLLNLKGEIIGINEVKFGISGAIPGNLAREVAEELIAFGKVRRSWLGIGIQPLLKQSGLEKGALVSGTIEGSPAEKAGFLPGDILLEIDGKEVSVRFPEEIPTVNQMIMGLPIGNEVTALIHRQGEKINLRITSVEREYIRPRTIELIHWGITARNLSLMAMKNLKRDNRDGVLVTSVRKGSPSWEAEPALIHNDVLVKFNDIPIKNVEELLRLTRETIRDSSRPLPVVVTFERKKEQYMTMVRLELEKDMMSQGVEAKKPWLPVALQVLTRDVAGALGIPEQGGMRITQVYPGSSAEKAGFRTGDIITGLNGAPLNVSVPEDYEVFTAMIRQYRIGSPVELTVLRGKKSMQIPVVLEPSPMGSSDMKRYRDKNFEFTVRDVALLDSVHEGWKQNEGGVLVESVSKGGWASLARLAVGDLILEAAGEPVSDIPSFKKTMRDIVEGKPDSVLFQVRRGIHNLFIELEPAW